MNSTKKNVPMQVRSRISKIYDTFKDHHSEISKKKIRNYLNQFKEMDRDLGLRVLENVNYFSNIRVTKQIKLLATLLNEQVGLKDENVLFCSMSATSGTSSDTMLGAVRRAAKLSSSLYGSKFIFLRDLEKMQPNENKKIIFVDDFIGSGTTVARLWELIQNWNCASFKFYIGIIVGYESVIEQIEEDYPFTIISAEEKLKDSSKIFHATNSNFNNKEKNIIKRYCKNVETRKEFRYGYKNTQSLLVFYENTPNNTIPILHHKTPEWQPLFLRLE